MPAVRHRTACGPFWQSGVRVSRPPIVPALRSPFWLVRRVTILSMLTEHILALLVAERDKLNRAIEALQGPTKRRGRPRKNPLAVATLAASAQPTKKKRRKFSAAQREAAAERMRQRWAAKRKAEAKSQPKTASRPKKTAKAA